MPPGAVPPGATDWRRHASALVRYRWLIVAVTLAGTAGGFGATRVLDPLYRAEATVWVEVGDARRADRGPVGPGQLLDSYAWIDLLKSYVVLDHVVRRLRLYVAESAPGPSRALATFDIRDPFQPGAYRLAVDDQRRSYTLEDDEQGQLLERGVLGDSVGRKLGFAWAPPPNLFRPGESIEFSLLSLRDAARDLAARLNLRMDPGGNFLKIELGGTSPQQIAAILNATTERYVDVAAQLKREKVSGLAQVLRDQLARAEQDLRNAEARLRRFQQTVLPRPAGRSGPEDPRLTNYLEFQVTLDQARRDREAIEAALRAPADSGGGLAGLEFVAAVQESAALQAALKELGEKRAELRTLRYRYTDAHPEVQRVAGEVAMLVGSSIPTLARQLASELRGREAQLAGWMASASGEVRAIPGQTIEAARLQRELTISENLYTTLQQRYDETRLAEASSGPDVRILDAAVAPTAPAENTAPRLLLAAFVGSLGVSLVGATLLGRLDRRVRGPEQVGLELGLPLLGVIPHIRTRGRRLSEEEAAELVEALRGIRLNVLHAYGAPPPVVLTVTSPGPGDGKSFVSSRLALALADAGYRTVLIDGDVRRGRLHRAFDRPRRPGLIDHLQGHAAVPEIIQKTAFGPLDFIACGTRSQGGPELLGSSPLRDLLATLRTRYEAVILDSAPMAAAIDPFVLGTATGTLLLVLRTGLTDREVTAAKLSVLDRLPIRPLGVVLNDLREPGAYRLYSYYLPGYSAEDEGEGRRRSLPAALSL